MNNNFNGDFLVIAHRGASYYEPENTLRAFNKAVEYGSRIIEFDVRRTKDDKLVVIHDKTLDRTTNGKGLVSSKTFDELRSLDAGKGEKIPLLEEVISNFKNKTKFVIELKEEGMEEQMLSLINNYSVKDDVFFVSFNENCLKKIRLLDSKVLTGLITVFGYNLVNRALDCNCNAVATNHFFATEKKASKAHLYDLLYFCWTVNNRKKGDKLRKMGVDGIITDRPNIFLI